MTTYILYVINTDVVVHVYCGCYSLDVTKLLIHCITQITLGNYKKLCANIPLSKKIFITGATRQYWTLSCACVIIDYFIVV